VASVADPARLAAGTTRKGERAGQQGRRASYRIIRGADGEQRPRLGRMHRTRKNRTRARPDGGGG
ncbi:hypothetical protein PIB30_116385, partial [Stylosanthes scabra]|nr:hypothetical protein [Stylosanthes scabra]